MRIVFIATGSVGDVWPIAQLAYFCSNHYKNSQCLLVTHKDLIEAIKLNYSKISENVQLLSLGTTVEESNSPLNPDTEDISSHDAIEDPFREIERNIAIDVIKGCSIVIFNLLFCELYSVAEYYQIPCVIVSAYMPFNICPVPIENALRLQFPHLSICFTDLWNSLRLWMWRLFLEDHGIWRCQRLQLDATPSLKNAFSLLFPISPKICFLPGWYPSNAFLMGYIQCDFDDDIPGEIKDFMRQSAPVAYVGFGSMEKLKLLNSNNLPLLISRILECMSIYNILWQCEDKGYLHTFLKEKCYKNVCILNTWINHKHLFSLVDVAIHHGGIGTIQSCLKANLPQVIIPFAFDQFSWREKLVYQELAGGIQNGLEFTVDELRRALTIATCKHTKDQLQVVAKDMKNEDPFGFLVNIIDNHLQPVK